MNKYHWIAGVLFLLAALCSTGHHQGDEHFQILEFAAYKLGRAEATDLTWEFHARMRPSLQPALAYAVSRLLGVVGADDPFFVAGVLRGLSAAATLLLLTVLHRRIRPAISADLWRGFSLFLFFHWCLYYTGVRFSSETWGGLCAIGGLLAYPLPPPGDGSFTPAGRGNAWLAGALFGLAFLFRYQMAVFVAGWFLWWIILYRREIIYLLRAVAAGLLVLALAYPLTFWLYDEWTLPAWNYLTANLIEGRAAAYGTLPVWAYLELVVLRGIPPLGIAYAAGTLYFLYRFRRDPLAWCVGTFVLVHSLLGRKDIRFLYPLIPLLPVMLTATWQQLRRSIDLPRVSRGLSYVCVALNCGLLATVTLRPAASEIAPLRFVYRSYPGPATLCGPQAGFLQAEGATPRFYLRAGHRIAQACTTVSGEPVLYMARTRVPAELPNFGKLVFTDRPDWLLPYLPFGLLQREKWYYVYELPPDGG